MKLANWISKWIIKTLLNGEYRERNERCRSFCLRFVRIKKCAREYIGESEGIKKRFGLNIEIG